MKTRIILVLVVLGAALAVNLAWFRPRKGPAGQEAPQPQPVTSTELAESAPPPTPTEPVAPPRPKVPAASKSVLPQRPIPAPTPSNKADRLAQLRETFRALDPEHLAAAMADVDPADALAFAEQLNADDRRKFSDSLFASWAEKDTEAALQRAEQMSDPAEQEAALKAIRSVAPVGIGAELRMQDGYPVINRLVPGTPAELGGVLHPGDRILGVAQGDYAFVDARNLPLAELVQAIRGAPGTLLQLQVRPADAPPESQPNMVSIVRGQIKFKR